MLEKKIIIDGIETNYCAKEDGTIWNLKTGRELKGTLARNEYRSVQLTVNGKLKSYMTHRLIAETFCDNPNDYNIVIHKDGDPYNNAANNLKWMQAQEQKKTQEKRTAIQNEIDVKKEEGWKCLSWLKPNTYYISEWGEIWNSKNKKILSPEIRNGYKRVSIGGSRYSVHCLVYEAFVGEIPEGCVIDHIDGNRANNNISNLRFITQSENMKNAMKNGHKCQVPVLQFDKQNNFIKEYNNIQEAANAMGVTHAAVRSAIGRGGTCKGYYWKKKD